MHVGLKFLSQPFKYIFSIQKSVSPRERNNHDDQGIFRSLFQSGVSKTSREKTGDETELRKLQQLQAMDTSVGRQMLQMIERLATVPSLCVPLSFAK